MQDVTCGIKTLMRPASLRQLLDSIYRMYPKMRCVVVDDGKTPALARSYPHWSKIKYIKLPFDTGLGESRNVMIDAVDTKYCVYLDDDFFFTPKTNLAIMQQALDENKADLVAGKVREGKRCRLYHGLLQIQQGTLIYKRAVHRRSSILVAGEKIPLVFVDVTLNFFMGRTELLQQVKWDSELKINTHTEFFIRAKDKMRIAFCPAIEVAHKHVGNMAYKKLRFRKYRMRGLAKHGITKVKFIGGKWG